MQLPAVGVEKRRGERGSHRVAALSSFWCSYARKKGEGGGGEGCCCRGDSKRDAADGGAHQLWVVHDSVCEGRDTTGDRLEG
jgi:hypothetical protein